MSMQQLRKGIQELKAAIKIKTALPWDCKSLMSQYKMYRAEQEIIYKLAKIRGETCNLPDPYKLEVDDRREFSREAREFLSLSAEKQGEVVDYYFPPGPPPTKEETEEFTREILDQLNRIRARNSSKAVVYKGM